MIKKILAMRYFKNRVLLLMNLFKIIRAKRILRESSKEPNWLGQEVLEELQQKYPREKACSHPKQRKQHSRQVALGVAKVMHTCFKKIKLTQNIIEIGCGSGLVSYFLKNEKNKITAIDVESKSFSKEASDEDVITCLQMDANYLQFQDEQFDFLFSLNAFEHFSDPEKVLQEMIRVVKTGGYIYLLFNPLYMSPWGLHARRAVSVPYCHLLFPKETLQDFVASHNLPKIPFSQVNGWSLKSYRKLYSKYSNILKRVDYIEIYEPRHLDLMMKYSSCFASKSEDIKEFIVSGMVVLFQKMG